MAFVSGKGKCAAAAKSRAGVVFVSPADSAALSAQTVERTLVVAGDPKDAFFSALKRLKPARPPLSIGQSPQAFIHPNAKIGPHTNVHPGATIGSGVVIGSHCEIHPGVSIGPGCRIGDRVSLHPNVVLYHDVTLGNRVTVQAGSVIGADGFGYRTRDGRHERIPHFGTVRIEDDVDIGACTTIDRAVIGETVIGEGTKIDNNVVIAHNCLLGKHNLLVSQVGFAGSVTTGDYVVCAGQVGIADHVNIGSGAILGAKAGVHKDLAGGKTYLGAPAAPIEEATRAVMTLQKLPQLRQSLRELERQMAALHRKIDGESDPVRSAA
jgi:UDP-3-O-[3-hydroxymyristoyl] glucosamine N-acyltransferase